LTATTHTAGHNPQSRYFIWILASFTAFACLYIFRLSFVIDGVRYFTLVDDQMISMRYAENLAHGHGLVWNVGGPKVEGYTNFAWMLYMAVFHLLKIPRPTVSLFLQATGAACLTANLFFVKKIAGRISQDSAVATFFALVLTAFYIPLDNWALQGTEVGVLTLMVTAGAWLSLEVIDGRVPYALYLLLGASTLVRPDMVVFAAAVLSGLAIWQRERRRQHLLIGGLIVVTFVAMETAFRLWYFGDPLPNTYYLKMTGFPLLPRIMRGSIVAAIFGAQLLPLLMLIDSEWKTLARSASLKLVLWIFLGQVAYSVFAGGDTWEWWGGSNRFISIAMPLFFVGAAMAMTRRFRENTISGGAVGATVVLLLAVNLLALARDKPLERLLLIEPPFELRSDRANVEAALALRSQTRDNDVIAVTWAGMIPYFSERPAIDLLGKMDPHIAHEAMHRWPDSRIWTGFYPGHLKWDYRYSIDELKPDLIQAPLWRLSYELDDPRKYLEPEYELRQLGSSVWYVRRASPPVLRIQR
jgi:hypothetical protein